MNKDQRDQKNRTLRAEQGWRDLSAAQRRGVAVGFATIVSALAVGCSQSNFNGLSVLALLAAVAGLVMVLAALHSR